MRQLQSMHNPIELAQLSKAKHAKKSKKPVAILVCFAC